MFPGSGSKIRLGRGGLVSLRVYVVLGREVMTGGNENLTAGDHKIESNAESVPGGICLNRVTICDYVATKTMILIRRKS